MAAKFYATDPNGKIHTRTSKTKKYTHCAFVRYYRVDGTRDDNWTASHWSQSLEGIKKMTGENSVITDATAIKPGI